MEDVIRQDGRYPPEAFAFLHDGLGHAVKGAYGGRPVEVQDPEQETARHVTGEQLCCAMRDLAIERWGRLARTVLTRWNIHATIDFGNMVYLLGDNSFMRKTDDDSIEDFRGVFGFDEAFNVEVDLRTDQ